MDLPFLLDKTRFPVYAGCCGRERSPPMTPARTFCGSSHLKRKSQLARASVRPPWPLAFHDRRIET